MAKPTIVQISTPNDIILTVPRLLGFAPRNSLVVICTHGSRTRFGLSLRFDLDWTRLDGFIDNVVARVRHEEADSCFLILFSDDRPASDSDLPYAAVVTDIDDGLCGAVQAAFLVVDSEYWAYCDDPTCCRPGPRALDPTAPGVTAMAAAHALRGRGVLPSREAVAESIAYDGDDNHRETMLDLLAEAEIGLMSKRRGECRTAVRELVARLCSEARNPHWAIDHGDVATLAALCQDVIVRDEVLVRALKPRRRESLQRMLTAAVRRLPPPDDAPLCSVLAWVAYVAGNGVVANVALDRAFASDPEYSLAQLIADSLHRQVPPWELEEVMRGAARDLKHRREAG